MKEEVSVSKAIFKGHLFITFPCLLILFIPLSSIIYLVDSKLICAWYIVIIFIICTCFIITLHRYSISHWRIWSFSNVRNVHDLKEKAIRNALIYPDDSVFKFLEYKSESQKTKWIELSKKFDIPDQFENDINIPTEYIISKSWFNLLFSSIISILIAVIALYSIFNYTYKELLFYFGLIMLVTSFFSFKEFLKLYKLPSKQIVLDSNGINITKNKFYSWYGIENEKVKFSGYEKNEKYFLEFYFTSVDEINYNIENEFIYFPLENLNTSSKKIEKLLRIYRYRYNNKIK